MNRVPSFAEHVVKTKLGKMRILAAKNEHRLNVVCVHGLIVSSSFMEPTARLLASHYNVYVPDLLGHGKSETPEQAVSIEQHARCLAGALADLSIQEPVIVGGSYGCHVAVELANIMPVKSLVFVGPTPGDEFLKALTELSVDAFREPAELVLQVLGEVIRINPVRVTELLMDMKEYPFYRKLRNVKVPTLVIRGENDPFFSDEFIDGAFYFANEHEGICLPDKAHGLPFSEPETISNFIEEFLERRCVNSKSARGRHGKV